MCDLVNHTRFPKEKHLPYWARRGNKDKKGDRVEYIACFVSSSHILFTSLISFLLPAICNLVNILEIWEWSCLAWGAFYLQFFLFFIRLY